MTQKRSFKPSRLPPTFGHSFIAVLEPSGRAEEWSIRLALRAIAIKACTRWSSLAITLLARSRGRTIRQFAESGAFAFDRRDLDATVSGASSSTFWSGLRRGPSN